jgi:small nuclear ribonucleoprotein (snRNP)-like protein
MYSSQEREGELIMKKNTVGKNGKVSVFTNDGDKLVGFIVEVDNSLLINPDISFILGSGQEGIWLRREKHLTFLDEDNIKLIRPAKFNETEKTY